MSIALESFQLLSRCLKNNPVKVWKPARPFKILAIAFMFAVTALVSTACDFQVVGGDVTPSVCREAIEVNVAEDSAGLGSTCTESFCSLRAAVILANECPGMNTIQLQANTYELTLEGSGEEGGDLNITDDLAILGRGQEATTIAGRTGATGLATWRSRILSIETDVAVTIKDLTIEGGRILERNGAGIFNSGELTLELVTLRGNHVLGEGNGGALYNEGQATLSGVQVLENSVECEINDTANFTCTSGCGGGIANVSPGTLFLGESHVSMNSSHYGGGICHGSASLNGLIIQLSEIVDNFSGFGGGIFLASDAVIVDTLIGGNIASQGGGINASLTKFPLSPPDGFTPGATGTPHIQIVSTIIEQNQAVVREARVTGDIGNGGGLYLRDIELLMDLSLVIQNESFGDGGGIYLRDLGPENSISQSAIVSNSNSAELARGGGLLIWNSPLSLVNVTVSENRADTGGGIYTQFGSTLNIWNSTIATNEPSGLSAGGSGPVNLTNTLIGRHTENCTGIEENIISSGGNMEDADSCNLSAATDQIFIPSDWIVAPLFIVPLSSNPTSVTYVHFPSGEAVDYLEPASCPADDQRLAGRPIPTGGLCDVGAYETTSGGRNPDAEAAEVDVTPTIPGGGGQGDVTTLRDTPCHLGPGLEWGIANYFAPGIQTELVGFGLQDGWVVTDHPALDGVNCWLIEDDVSYTAPSDDFPFIEAPQRPTATPAPTKEPRPEDPPTEAPPSCDPQQQQCP